MSPRFVILCAAALALQTGCAQQPNSSSTSALPSTSAVATAAAQPPSTDLDGMYRPPQGGAPGNSACRNGKTDAPIRVADGIASLRSNAQGVVEGKIAPDGSLSARNGSAVLSGRFTPGRFDGNYSVNRCVYTMSYTKQ